MTLSPIEADFDLPICSTCGFQWTTESECPDTCPICLDDRQWVPEGGTVWTSLRKLAASGRTNEFRADPTNSDVTFISTVPHHAIGQMPAIIKTKSGYVIVECCSYIDQQTVDTILATCKKDNLPLLGIAISHPHWYNTSVIWARALDTKIYIHALDKQWWFRKEGNDRVVWFDGDSYKISPEVTMVLVGGHFDGICVTHIDNGPEKKGIMCLADAIMISPSSRHNIIAVMWSYPNYIPLPPDEVMLLWNRIKPYSFGDAYSGWRDKKIIGDAKSIVFKGIRFVLKMEGLSEDKILISLD